MSVEGRHPRGYENARYIEGHFVNLRVVEF